MARRTSCIWTLTYTRTSMLGSFCFVPPLTTLMMMSPALREDNVVWRMVFVCNSDGTSGFPPRPLRAFNTVVQPSQPPTMEVFVFHGTVLCPRGRPIDIATDRHLDYPNERSGPTYTLKWRAYTASGNQLIQVHPPYDNLDRFTPPNLRSSYRYSQISHFAVLVAAHSKFQHFVTTYGFQALSPRGQDYFHLLNENFHQIWYTPDQNLVDVTPYVLRSEQYTVP
ncbi:hypothetical protein BDN70DRAFT_508436 [Pholiota conissans]|uniref:Uncharacterized protein n=1 Tax=Pholiota conissans TaxID=109636 RepID=A0A9P6CMB1_9AGAR|nr:hypothetical protein BDN70DRAFT_508436 [Pholiota conissans]